MKGSAWLLKALAVFVHTHEKGEMSTFSVKAKCQRFLDFSSSINYTSVEQRRSKSIRSDGLEISLCESTRGFESHPLRPSMNHESYVTQYDSWFMHE